METSFHLKAGHLELLDNIPDKYIIQNKQNLMKKSRENGQKALGRKELIMSLPSEVKNLNAKCADTAFLFYFGCQKKCKCGKTEGGLLSRESIYIRLQLHQKMNIL